MSIQFGAVAPAASGSSVASASPAPSSASAAKPNAQRPKAPVQASTETLQQVASQINEFLKANASDVQFTVDAASDRVVVRVVDSQTGELIRQIPSDEMLAISHALDHLEGLILKQKA